MVEIASREFMDNLTSILKMPGLNYDVKNKILRLVQNWAIAFEGKNNLGYVGEVYRILQNEGTMHFSRPAELDSPPSRFQLPTTRPNSNDICDGRHADCSGVD